MDRLFLEEAESLFDNLLADMRKKKKDGMLCDVGNILVIDVPRVHSLRCWKGTVSSRGTMITTMSCYCNSRNIVLPCSVSRR